MIFSSALFILFLLLVMSVYYIVPTKLRHLWLLLASYVFCLMYDVNALIVLVGSTLVSYLFGLILDRMKWEGKGNKAGSRIWLWVGVICCIAPLLLAKTGRFSLFAVIGVSFYTLQEIGYLSDICQGKSRAEKSLLNYALFIAFFPKLVSGPIERSGNLLKQIKEASGTVFEYDRVKSGFLLMLWGYFQKSVIADSFSGYVSKVYDQWEAYSGAVILLATVVFAFQLYADFAGYTNIVLGAAKVLGYQLQENFLQPYLAVSIRDFWRRWHISLSAWLRDYIYIPLGGNRRGKLCKYINLMITFVVSGLWHGLSFNYVAWGMLHGAYQVIGEFVGGRKLTLLLRRVGVFALVNIAWVFFRAGSLKAAIGMLLRCVLHFSPGALAGDVFSSLGLGMTNIVFGAACIVLLLLADVLHERQIHVRVLLAERSIVVRWLCYMVLVLLLAFVEIRRCGIPASNFIYSQF